MMIEDDFLLGVLSVEQENFLCFEWIERLKMWQNDNCPCLIFTREEEEGKSKDFWYIPTSFISTLTNNENTWRLEFKQVWQVRRVDFIYTTVKNPKR